ncbi:MAG TPA: DNA repair protein RadC [Ktedonobacteraceae bacterium]|nr:DNA repair protein RadC [Ktedonobacteraceae bacterium]
MAFSVLDDNPLPLPTRLEYHATVHDIPTNERPRERLHTQGPQALSNAELLAIILRTGTARDNVLELAGKLLARYGGLGGLMRTDFNELCLEHGLGVAKTAQLKAALEIGKRLKSEQVEEKYQIRSPRDAANLVMIEMTHLDHEQMRILVLDTKNQVVENVNRYQGTVNSSVLRVAEIFRPAITRNCPAVIVCHNHPSGDPTPSPEDIAVTEQLVQAGKVLDIELVDHLIIGSHRYISLKEQLRW